MTALVASCGTPSPPNNTGLVASDATRTAIEALMRQRADAMTRRDLPAFEATFDRTRPPLRRTQAFLYQQVENLGPPTSAFKVLSIEPYLDRYVRGLVEEDAQAMSISRALGVPTKALYVQYYFRRDGDRWLLTEPRSDETGGERNTALDQIEIRYDAMDDGVIGRVAPELQKIRRSLDALAPAPVTGTLAVRLHSTAESAGPNYSPSVGCTGNSRGIVLYPTTISFVASGSLSIESYHFIQGCASFWLREQVVPGVIDRISNDWWLDQGWSDLAGGIDRTTFFRAGCAGVPVPTLAQMRGGPPPLEAPEATVETYGRYLSYANSMVDYLYATYGKGKFWELMRAYKDDASASVTFPKVLNVTPARFYADWAAWERTKHC